MGNLSTSPVVQQTSTGSPKPDRSGSLADGKQLTSPPQATKQQQKENTKTARLAAGVGLAGLVGLGVTCKDGLTEGFKRIGSLGRVVSSIFAIPATFLIPITTAYGEYEEYKVKNPTEESSNQLIESVYPILSIAFAPMTAFEPLEKATQSKGHMITTLINLPQICFTFFSYTGGRFLTLIKSLKLATFNLSEEERFRLKNEKKLVRTIADIGSDNAAVTPQAHQFMTGWQTITDFLKGNFSSIKERLFEAPVTTFLGTFVSSIFWIPTLIGKSFDTVIRTLETTDNLKHTISPKIYENAQKAKTWWHQTSASSSFTGKILSLGREFGKIMQAVASPMGMLSVVFPAFDQFAHGFSSEEAKDSATPIRLMDKALNIGAFLSHCYFTVLYGAFVRLPQTITTIAYYTCNGINKMRGVLDKPDAPNYLDPRKIRDHIFNPNKGWAKKISDFAGNIIEKNTGKKFLYDNIYKVIAEQECYSPIKEIIYRDVIEGEQYEITDELTGQTIVKTKKAKEKPPLNEWGKILENKKDYIFAKAEERLRKYLKEASGFDEVRINDFFNNYKIYDKIKAELKEIIQGEINECSEKSDEQVNIIPKDSKPKFEKPKLKSDNFFQMISNPAKYWDDIKEVFKFRTAIAQLVISPLNVLDFVNIVEMGDKKLPYHLSNWLVQESSIRIGDYKAGNIGELMTVYNHALQTCGKGMANIYKAGEKVFGMAA